MTEKELSLTHRQVIGETSHHTHMGLVGNGSTKSPEDNTRHCKTVDGNSQLIYSTVCGINSGEVSLSLVETDKWKRYDWDNRYKLAYNGVIFYTGGDVKSLLEQAYVEVFHGNPRIEGSMEEPFINDVLAAIVHVYSHFYPVSDNDSNVATNGNLVSLSYRAKVERPFIRVGGYYNNEIGRDFDIYIQRGRVNPDMNSDLFYKTVIKVAISSDVVVTKQFHHHLSNIPFNGGPNGHSKLVDRMIDAAILLYKLKV